MSTAEKSDPARGLLSSINNRLGMPQPSSSSPSPKTRTPTGNVPQEGRAQYENIFHEHCQGKPYLTGIEAAILLLESRLHKNVLSSVWEQADVSRDGRFSCDEFCRAMWLIDMEKGRSPSSSQQQQQYSASYASTSAHQDTGAASSNPPAYPLPPLYQQRPQSPHFPYGVPPPRPPVYNDGYASQPSQAVARLEMLAPLICQGCDTGLIPCDIVYRCTECKDGVSTFCSTCHGTGKQCCHDILPSKLEAGTELKNEDKDGDFGFGLKCDGCRAKLTQGMLCWHCKRCFNPNFCKDCWRRRDTRCKHAARQGKVQLRRVGKATVTTEDLLDGLETVGDIVF